MCIKQLWPFRTSRVKNKNSAHSYEDSCQKNHSAPNGDSNSKENNVNLQRTERSMVIGCKYRSQILRL